MDISEEIRTIHRNILLVDAHSDTLSKCILNKESLFPDLEKYFQGGVNLQVFALYTPEKFLASSAFFTLEMIHFFNRWAKENQEVIPVTGATDLETIGADKLLCLLSIEGGEALEGKLFMLDIYYRLGVRAMGLTWNNRNHLADGHSAASQPGGLTYFGEKIVKRMNELGMIIDVSHMAEKGFWDVINLSKSPVIASHSNCRSLCKKWPTRNLSDEQILAISEKGGLVGITFVPDFLSEDPASVEHVVDHIEHIVTLTGGYDCAGIGSDFDGTDKYPEGLEGVTSFPLITACLLKRGHMPEDIEKVNGKNWLRVFSQILK